MSRQSALFGCHEAVFLDAVTNTPLAITDLVSTVSINNTGDLVERRGGSHRMPLEHFEAANSVEVQITLKKWAAEFLQISTGAVSRKITDVTTATTIETVKTSGGGAGVTVTSEDEDNGTPVFGYHLLQYDATASKWIHSLVGSPENPNRILGSEFALADAHTLTTTEEKLGFGLDAKIESGYTPAAGDSILFRVIPENPDALTAYYASITDKQRRPYIQGIFSAESAEGILYTIRVPKMKCSSGLPVTMTEKTDAEYQLTFMASLVDRNTPIIEFLHVA